MATFSDAMNLIRQIARMTTAEEGRAAGAASNADETREMIDHLIRRARSIVPDRP